jgi:SAM-dependent methyltransferase
MDQHILDAQKAYWNGIFAQAAPSAAPQHHWLEEMLQQTATHLNGHVLEIGCGRGHDTRYLLQMGCRVTSLDLAWNALKGVAHRSPSVGLVNAALPAALPFRPAAFTAVVAGLSLHYFRWHDTLRILQEIARVLQPGGRLMFQVNSIEDTAHGAGSGEEIEPHLFLYQSRFKRFFTERMCRDIFDSGWEIDVLMPRLETRFGSPKPTWAGISRRVGERSQNDSSI